MNDYLPAVPRARLMSLLDVNPGARALGVGVARKIAATLKPGRDLHRRG